MKDRLVWLLQRFPLRAHTFQTGALQASADFEPEPEVGYLHLLTDGAITVTNGGESISVSEPSALLYLSPTRSRISPAETGAQLICARLDFGLNRGNPLAMAVSKMYQVTLRELNLMDDVLQQLFLEAKGEHCGRQAILDRLMEVVLVLLLRDLMDNKRLNIGLMAGLADDRLHKTLNALHEKPADAWTIETMASAAGMSRARFAEHFHKTIGITPADYLSDWRLGLAETYLIEGNNVEQAAQEVGYGSASALSRAFTNRRGMSPKIWLKNYRDKTDT